MSAIRDTVFIITLLAAGSGIESGLYQHYITELSGETHDGAA